MLQIPTNENRDIKEAPEEKKHPGIIVDVKQWSYIKKKYRMTNRELQVAILICRDFENDRIAQLLNIGPTTVKTHLRNIYRKTHVRKKLSLLLRFVEDIKETNLPPAPLTSVKSNEPQPAPSGTNTKNP
ncbi:MAG: LuxR C-terminal-related transcriptional regulator [Phycisphaerales bacterium]